VHGSNDAELTREAPALPAEFACRRFEAIRSKQWMKFARIPTALVPGWTSWRSNNCGGTNLVQTSAVAQLPGAAASVAFWLNDTNWLPASFPTSNRCRRIRSPRKSKMPNTSWSQSGGVLTGPRSTIPA
jgi:hypothetical protein